MSDGDRDGPPSSSSDDEGHVSTPDVSWSASSGKREASFKKKSPDALSFTRALPVSPGAAAAAAALPSFSGESPRFTPAAPALRKKALDSLRQDMSKC